MKVKRWSRPAYIAFSLLFVAIMCFALLPSPVQIGPLSFGGAGVAEATTVQTKYTASGNFTVPVGVTTLTVLIVAGGGGGGGGYQLGSIGAGGGAGGAIFWNGNYTVAGGQTIIITVGSLGAGGPAGNNPGTNGGNSTISGGTSGTLTAVGGGGGGTSTVGKDGGSGGGGATGSLAGGIGTSGQGKNGGAGETTETGGGGGYGAVGVTAVNQVSGNGGVGGDFSSYFSGLTFGDASHNGYVAGGGGGGTYDNTYTAGTGGWGGGGNGGKGGAGYAAQANTGGGGGGGAEQYVTYQYAGGNGGSGVVIIKYTTFAPPTIATLAATLITTTTATLNGNVTSLGDFGNVTSYGFGWDTVSHPINPGNVTPANCGYAGNWTSGTVNYGAAQAFDSAGNVTGLTPDAFYYARAAGYSTYGWVYGDEILFRNLKDLSSVDWGQSGNWTYRQKIEIHGSGSIAGTVTASSSTVTGIGTTFTDWLIGDDIYIAGTWYPITAIASGTSLTVTGTPTAATAAPYDMRHVDYPVRFDLMSNKSIIPVNSQMVMKGATEAASVVLDVGTAGAWDDYGVGCVQVVPKGDGTFYQIYNGWGDAPSQGEPMRIGMATSPNLTNGGTWTKTTSGIGGTSKVLAAPLGYESIFGYDVYKVDSTWYLIGGPFHDAMVFTNKDYIQQWLYSTTDFITFTEIGWGSDIYDIDWATLHLVMNPNGSLLKDNDGVPVQVGGYYYMATSALTDDATTEYGIRMMRSTTLESRTEINLTGEDTTTSVYGTGGTGHYLAQTFTTHEAQKATAVRLKLSQTGTTTDDLTVSIQALSSGKPSGTDLVHGHFDAVYLDGDAEWVSVRLKTVDVSANLTDATQYAVVVKYPTGTSSNYIKVSIDSANSYADGGATLTTDGGTNWAAESGDAVFVVHKSIWSDMGWVQDPSDYNTTNTYISIYIFDNKLLKWGDQYMVVHGGGYDVDTQSLRRAYFSYSNDISNIDSWVMCKEPWYTSPYKFEGRSSFYDDGTTLHIWTDWRIAAAWSDVRVVYFSNNINSIISLGGHALTTFADVRWMDDDSDADLKHFMEESVQDSVNGWASQWVKVPYIPSSGQSAFVWIYYGNAGAADTQDGANVFTLYDHFTSLDLDKWSLTGNVTQAGTQVAIVASAAADLLYSDTNYGVGYAFRTRSLRVGVAEDVTEVLLYVDTNNWRSLYKAAGLNLEYRGQKIGGAATYVPTTIHARTDNVWHVKEVTRYTNGYSKFYIDYFLQETISAAMAGSAVIRMQNDSSTVGHEIDIDWAIVRKVCTTEPLVWAASTVSETADISNTPSSYDFGVVQPSQAYWAGAGEKILSQLDAVQVSFLYSGEIIRTGEELYLWPASTISAISLYMRKHDSPTGTAYVQVRKVSDDSVIGTLGNISVSTLTESMAYYTFNTTPVTITEEQDIYILCEYSGGDSGNYIAIGRSDTNVYAGGNRVDYLSSYTDISGNDLTWQNLIYTSSELSWPLVASGCIGSVTNNSSFTLDYLTVVITDFSGGTAINIVSTAPGANEARVMIFESGAGNTTDGIYLTNAAQNWVADVTADEEVLWELKLETGNRNTFAYGVYTATLTFTTDPAGDSETVTITFTWGDRRRGIGIAPCMFY